MASVVANWKSSEEVGGTDHCKWWKTTSSPRPCSSHIRKRISISERKMWPNRPCFRAHHAGETNHCSCQGIGRRIIFSEMIEEKLTAEKGVLLGSGSADGGKNGLPHGEPLELGSGPWAAVSFAGQAMEIDSPGFSVQEQNSNCWRRELLPCFSLTRPLCLWTVSRGWH